MSANEKSRGRNLADLAQRRGTPMAQDEELTGLLSQVAPADNVPDSLLQVLAQTLAFVENLEKEAQRSTAQE